MHAELYTYTYNKLGINFESKSFSLLQISLSSIYYSFLHSFIYNIKLCNWTYCINFVTYSDKLILLLELARSTHTQGFRKY